MKNLYRLDTRSWYVERAVYLLAGIVELITIGLGLWVASWWLWLSLFVACMLVFFSLTGWCPTAMTMHWLGLEGRNKQ